MSSRSTDIVFLLGAGASADASIPTSAAMISQLEGKLSTDPEWSHYRMLYHHVKSAIYYREGLAGRFDSYASYNIEVLVNTLYELERNEEHPLYPFIASWNTRFVAIAGEEFEQVRQFRLKILQLLKSWICPDDETAFAYFKGLQTIQEILNFPLQIFSLNYDLCVESVASEKFVIETGFEDYGPQHPWSYGRFLDADRGSVPLPQAFLYKLHGSIDWKRESTNTDLIRVKQVHNISEDEMEIIFGREAKLEAADPYLFYAYEFRRNVIESKLIVIIGYGFADAHINKILKQGVLTSGPKKLFVVGRVQSDQEAKDKESELSKLLGINQTDIKVSTHSSKSFFESEDTGSVLISEIPQPDTPF